MFTLAEEDMITNRRWLPTFTNLTNFCIAVGSPFMHTCFLLCQVICAALPFKMFAHTAVFFGCKTIVLPCNGWRFLYFLMEVLWTSMLVYLCYSNSGKVQNFPVDFGNSQCWAFLQCLLFLTTLLPASLACCPITPLTVWNMPCIARGAGTVSQQMAHLHQETERLCRYQQPEKVCFVFLISPLTLWFCFFCMLSAVGRIAKIIICQQYYLNLLPV